MGILYCEHPEVETTPTGESKCTLCNKILPQMKKIKEVKPIEIGIKKPNFNNLSFF